MTRLAACVVDVILMAVRKGLVTPLKHGHYTADAIARRIRDLLGSMKALAAAVDICCSRATCLAAAS